MRPRRRCWSCVHLSVISNSTAEYQDYEEDEATLALRQQMTDINAWLCTADITCSHPQVDPAQRRLRRIFNNSDFAQGRQALRWVLAGHVLG